VDELNAVTRISAEGKILYTYPFVEEVIGLDVSTQKHNAEIIKTNKPIISDPFITVQGYRAIAYAYPIIKNEEYHGCVSIVVPFKFIAEKYIEIIKVGNTSKNMVLSEDGIELYCSNEEHIGKSIYSNAKSEHAFQPQSNNLQQDKFGHGEYSYFDNNSQDSVSMLVVYKSVPLENTFWTIALEISKGEVLEANRGVIVKITLLFILLSFGVLMFLYFYARQRRKTRRLINEKENKYKANLENLVTQRTKELKSLNDSLKEDIVKRREIEKELKGAIEKVEKSERIKSEFLAQMSHEIRTPVNTILSFSSLIKEELSRFADEELKYGFSGIESASKRLIRTIDLILNMSDIQLGTHDYFPKEVDICSDILDNLLIEYKVQLNDKKLNFNLIKKDDELKIICDSYTTNQIFANLIDNAIKYTKEGSITIECGRNNTDNLYVSISDTGLGISEKYMPNLFDEFSQEDMGYTRKFEGNGLGLALVKKYCELNNFEIFAESKKNIGSKFTVILKKERPIIEKS
jgi:signal transduction histidine kinase